MSLVETLGVTTFCSSSMSLLSSGIFTSREELELLIDIGFLDLLDCELEGGLTLAGSNGC